MTTSMKDLELLEAEACVLLNAEVPAPVKRRMLRDLLMRYDEVRRELQAAAWEYQRRLRKRRRLSKAGSSLMAEVLSGLQLGLLAAMPLPMVCQLVDLVLLPASPAAESEIRMRSVKKTPQSRPAFL